MSEMNKIRASAGAGKTHTLTKKYLDLMMACMGGESGSRQGPCAKKPFPSGDRLIDILAITFTNAAVEEIQKRVISSIKKLSLGIKIEGLENISQRQASYALKELLNDMDGLNVRTIDSILHQITRAAALSLGLSPDFAPVFKTEEALKPWLEAFFQDAFLGDEEKRRQIKSAVANFLEFKSSSSEAAPLLMGEGLEKKLESFFDDVLINADSPYASEEEAGKAREIFYARAKEEAEKIKACPEAMQNENFWYADFKKLLNSFGPDQPEEKADILLKPLGEQIQKKFQGSACLETLEPAYQRLAENYIGYQACKEHLAYIRIVNMCQKIVSNFKADLPQADNIPSKLIPVLSRQALSIEDGVCDSLCRMGSRLSHFMLDEFQDTSREQWLGLEPLVEEALSRNGSLTWVGDPKQSIFMWRGASPELFDEIGNKNNLTRMTGGTRQIELERNWRSAAEIVNFNNAVFKSLKDPQKIKRVLSAINSGIAANPAIINRVCQAYEGKPQELSPKADPGGLVSISKFAYVKNDAKTREEFWNNFKLELISYINERVNTGEIAPSDVMILVRKNDEASRVASFLAEAGVPAITENSLLLNEEALVREATALLEFLINPHNDIALLTLLCGESFQAEAEKDGVKPEKFYALALEKNNGGKSAPLVDIFKKAYPGLWKRTLERYYKNSTIHSPYDIVREWFRTMKLEERFADRKTFLNCFLEYIHNAELNGISSAPAFLEHWKEEGKEAKAAMPDGVDAIKIMTIHKAKGLERPVVFFPIPDWDLKSSPNQSRKRVRLKIDGLDLSVRLLKIFKDKYDDTLMREALETLNILYVAITRAGKELHVYTSGKVENEKPAPKGKKKAEPEEPKAGVVETLLNEAGKAFRDNEYISGSRWEKKKKAISRDGASPEAEDKRGAKESETSVGAISESSGGEDSGEEEYPWLKRLRIARSAMFSEGDYAQKRGKFIHFCLENASLTGNPVQDARNALDFGVLYSGVELKEGDAEEIYQGLLWLFSQEQTKDWLDNGWPEHSLLDRSGNEKRVDLLVPRDWGALIIDYKTGGFASENAEQIRAYLESVRESGEFGDQVCGLLVYIDQQKFVPVGIDGPGEALDACPPLPFVEN